MALNDDDLEDLWLGTCANCKQTWTIQDHVLRETYPDLNDAFDEGGFTTACSECDYPVTIVCQHVQVVPFSAWTVLPPETGCIDCGQEHDPALPHDAGSLTYQYSFRNSEARAGRPERWPTWEDAMAHCDPLMQAAWKHALTKQGVVFDS